MITMIYVSKDELKFLQTDKQMNHCTSCLFSCLFVSNRQQSFIVLYLPLYLYSTPTTISVGPLADFLTPPSSPSHLFSLLPPPTHSLRQIKFLRSPARARPPLPFLPVPGGQMQRRRSSGDVHGAPILCGAAPPSPTAGSINSGTTGLPCFMARWSRRGRPAASTGMCI
jgi:hypothetical protein